MDNGIYQNFELGQFDIFITSHRNNYGRNLITFYKINCGRHDKYKKHPHFFMILMWKDNTKCKYFEPFSS